VLRLSASALLLDQLSMRADQLSLQYCSVVMLHDYCYTQSHETRYSDHQISLGVNARQRKAHSSSPLLEKEDASQRHHRRPNPLLHQRIQRLKRALEHVERLRRQRLVAAVLVGVHQHHQFAVQALQGAAPELLNRLHGRQRRREAHVVPGGSRDGVRFEGSVERAEEMEWVGGRSRAEALHAADETHSQQAPSSKPYHPTPQLTTKTQPHLNTAKCPGATLHTLPPL